MPAWIATPRGRPSRLIALAFAPLAMAACLPRGEPPAGRQLLADSTASLMTVTPPASDGTTRVLFFRPSQTQDPDLVDLWALTVDPNGGPSTEWLVFPGIAAGLQLSYRPDVGGSSFPIDARGRIYIVTDQGDDLFRVDLVTGDRQDLGLGQFPKLSPSGQRVLTEGVASTLTLYEADDRTMAIAGSQAQFLGETLFYVSTDCSLMRVIPAGTPEVIVAGVQTYLPFSGSLIMLQQNDATDCSFISPTGTLSQPALLDTTTLQQTLLPADLQYGFGGLSSDGRWLTASRYDPDTMQIERFLVDRTTGNRESLGIGSGYDAWRPGHNELWTTSYDESQPDLAGASLTIRIPGQPPSVTVPGVYASGFNDDGSYWYSRGTRLDQEVSSDLIGLADQPTGRRYHAVPQGSSLGLQLTLADGRLLIGSTTNVNEFRNEDYQLVDPRTGATNVLGLRGFLAAVGQTRILGIFDYSFERGDLTTVDFATGHQTVIAREFAMAAIAEAQSHGDFPPGAPIVYQFRARYDSPWSGLWLATAP